MKKLILILAIFGLLPLLHSCEKNIPADQPEEYVELGLRLKGVEISIDSITKGASSNDIYCVEVQKDDEGETYAIWVTDDITSQKFKLLKGHKYRFYVMYLPDGKNIIHGDDFAPFLSGMPWICPGLKDGICYGSQYGNPGAGSGAVRKKGDPESGMPAAGYFLNDVERYHGYAQVDEAVTNITLDVNLYRQMFALEIQMKNFTEGEIRISSDITGGVSYVNNIYNITPSDSVFCKTLELPGMPWVGANSEEAVKNYESEISFIVDYIAPDGESMTILHYRDYHKRMTKIKIQFDMKEILANVESGITPNVIPEDNWSEIEVK